MSDLGGGTTPAKKVSLLRGEESLGPVVLAPCSLGSFSQREVSRVNVDMVGKLSVRWDAGHWCVSVGCRHGRSCRQKRNLVASRAFGAGISVRACRGHLRWFASHFWLRVPSARPHRSPGLQ